MESDHPGLALLDRQFEEEFGTQFTPLDSALRVPEAQTPQWIAADTIAGVLAVRAEAEIEAESIWESRMDLLREGEFDSVPLDVDTLTTAKRALDAERLHGKQSETFKIAYESLVVDSERLFFEANRRLSWEYFPELEQPYDVEQDSYTYKGRSLVKVVADGVTPVATGDEGLFRISEYIEERTYGALRTVGRLALDSSLDKDFEMPIQPAQPDLSVITVSECSDDAIQAYEAGQRGGFGGQVPEIKKLMIRGVRFDHQKDSRYQSQLAVSGEHITHEVIVETYRRQKLVAAGRTLSKDDLRRLQVIDLSGQGPIGFLKQLDAVASELSGKRIFRGEVIPDDQVKDYANIPQEAIQRQERLKEAGARIAAYLYNLAEKGTDRSAAGGLLLHFTHNLLLEKVKYDPGAAAIAFGKETAQGVEKYTELRAQGRDIEAERQWTKVAEAAPLPDYCGAGSCGLVGVSTASEEGLQAQALGLNIKDSKDLLKDTERACPGCKRYKIFYDLRTGSKVCTGCYKKEIKK